MKIEYITEQDVTGHGRIVVDGKFYGVPATAVAIIKLQIETTRQRVKELEKALEESLLLQAGAQAKAVMKCEPVAYLEPDAQYPMCCHKDELDDEVKAAWIPLGIIAKGQA